MNKPVSISRETVAKLFTGFAGQGNVLAIPRPFIDLCKGDHLAALFLSQCLYWTDRTSDPDGWFSKSFVEWNVELAMSTFQVRRAVKALAHYGVEVKKRRSRHHSGAPTLHYRVNKKVMTDRVVDFVNGLVSNSLMEETHYSDQQETHYSYTETTAKTTKEGTPATQDARTLAPISQQNVPVEGIENTSQTDPQTDESLQKKESKAEGRAAKARSPKQEANDAANAMLIQGLGEAWGVMAVPSDEKDYLMVARKLVAGTVPLAEFKWYTQYQTRDAKDNGYTIQTIWGLIAKGRISKYVKARNDYRAQQEAGAVKGAWTGGDAKGGAYYHKVAPLQADSVPTGDVMAVFAEEVTP